MSDSPIITAAQLDAAECEAVLRSLPRWFGIEEALLEYASKAPAQSGFAVRDSMRMLGFLTLETMPEEPDAYEIYCLAMHADYRQQGLGGRLLATAEHWLRAHGEHHLYVRTLAASHPSPEYAETRRFYERAGFAAVSVSLETWGPKIPCLMMRKELRDEADRVGP
ncbi:GNAT family N-acetyltransferase [Viridibacterium curvum]|uniref:N-acetyltransferase domain-containing protein n=1 Tax=Viridibacterium curvum TaxID=1101404 RepID=A0ABP9QHC4_9RHOO